uniref:receptor homology region, transmembrane domain- and RING domain-containing protein 1 n=1 Tax=Fragaria vesca subsp. vesca TaxID=101020 RepID=UPI0005C85EE6|nr:PREDICTED: receptor homology region, transmembrane domain- and RING domain-containing protein 1 [Fragaria vesca subsp. vesca]
MELRKRKMRQVLLGFSVLVFVELSSATVVYKPLSMAFADLPAKFAVRVNSSGACGALANADPLNACSPLRNGRRSNETEKARFALIVRGECTFKDKIQNAQNAGFAAAIVYDDKDGSDLISMMINGENTTIHAVFVSKATGELLKEHAHDEEGECCIFPFAKETAWTVLAISFLSFIVILGILLIALFAPRHWLYSQGRNQLPKSVDTKVVEALPCFTFSSARLGECHSEETCAICLENYKDGEILKVLPCQHEFHSSCVDSWLTKWGSCCPVCKHDMRTKSVNPEIKRRTWLDNP